MAITLTQGNPIQNNAFSGTTTPGLAYTSAVTSGNTLVLFVSGSPTETINSVTDTVNSGSWTQAVLRSGNGEQSAIYFRLSTGAGTPTVTANLSAASLGIQLTLFEVAGASSPGLDKTNNNTSAGPGVSDPGNLNTARAASILIAGTENNNGESTGGTSYTFLDCVNGNNFASCQYRIVSSTSNYATAFATNTGGGWTAVAANFGEAAVASDTQEWLTTIRAAFNLHGPIIRNIPY